MSRLDPLSRLLFVCACLLAALAGVAILAVLAVCGLFDLCFARQGLTAGFERLRLRRMRLSRAP
jgi:hypothetical protein